MSAYSIEEFVDFVQNDITIYGALPKTLPDNSIRQYVETQALNWFYQNYLYATEQIYYYVDREIFNQDEYTNYRYVTLPCEIQAITWIYRIKNASLLQFGINFPNLSINLGSTTQPYLSSYITTIGELATYKSTIDTLTDSLQQQRLNTVKFDFNSRTHRLNILSGTNDNIGYSGYSDSLVLEAACNIPCENLFTDPLFIKYVTGWAKIQQGNLFGRYDFPIAGGVKVNSADLISQGKEEMKEVTDEIKGMSNSSFIIMTKH
jgi:hypothetical protein